MNRIIPGDITNFRTGLIIHQVNCRGAMGAGVALSIARKWPITKKIYADAFRAGELHLGSVIIAPITKWLKVAHLCGQEDYGRQNIRYTNYAAIHDGLAVINDMPFDDIYIPYNMGCGLAGGEWDTVSNIIFSKCPRATIVKFGGFTP